MVTAIIKLDANWISDTLKAALSRHIAEQGMTITQFEIKGLRLNCRTIWLTVECRAATKQSDEAQIQVEIQDIEQWLEEGLINKGYDLDQLITTPKLNGKVSGTEDNTVSNLVLEFKYKCNVGKPTQT